MIQTHADITAARQLLGWEPTNSIADIVRDEVTWQKPKIKRKHNV
jgi:nucleoside-diphosphate-sugar epimerase